MTTMTPEPPTTFRAVRLAGNPIIRPGQAGLAGALGESINGPSLIRVPPWVRRPLGRYYLYFAHHGGRFIRMAYADAVAGPWTVHGPGTLRLDQTPCCSHIASPDVHVSHDPREIRMYFHGPVPDRSEQVTFAAVSSDGLAFRVCSPPLGEFYFRVFRHGGWYYALAKLGNAAGMSLLSRQWCSPFKPGQQLLPAVRHTAPLVRGDTLWVFHTLAGDCPERVLLTRIDLSVAWGSWRATPPEVVLEPEHTWEGADLPAAASAYGPAPGAVRQLRDPGVFVDEGRLYLLYSVAGEQGIAIARLLDAT